MELFLPSCATTRRLPLPVAAAVRINVVLGTFLGRGESKPIPSRCCMSELSEAAVGDERRTRS